MTCACGKPVHIKRSGLCKTCYARGYYRSNNPRRGTLTSMNIQRRAEKIAEIRACLLVNPILPKPMQKTLDKIVRFWARVDRSGGPDACWPWLGSSHYINKRYPDYVVPRYSSGRIFGEKVATLSYRIAYILGKGLIPKGMTVDHICFNPMCCNPAHLQLLTASENAARKDPAKKRGGELFRDRARATHCKKGHELTPENTYRNGGCKECGDIRRAKYYAANATQIAAKQRARYLKRKEQSS